MLNIKYTIDFVLFFFFDVCIVQDTTFFLLPPPRNHDPYNILHAFYSHVITSITYKWGGTTRDETNKVDSMERLGAGTISWRPGEKFFTLILQRQSCRTWPDFRRWSPSPLSSLFTQGDVDSCGQLDQANAPIMTWGKSYSTSCGWADAMLREPTGGGRIWVSVSSRGQGGVSSNEEWRFYFILSSPQSHIKGVKAVMNPHLPYSQYTHT